MDGAGEEASGDGVQSSRSSELYSLDSSGFGSAKGCVPLRPWDAVVNGHGWSVYPLWGAKTKQGVTDQDHAVGESSTRLGVKPMFSTEKPATFNASKCMWPLSCCRGMVFAYMFELHVVASHDGCKRTIKYGDAVVNVVITGLLLP